MVMHVFVLGVCVSGCHLLLVWGQLWRRFGACVPSVLCLHFFLSTHEGNAQEHTKFRHAKKQCSNTECVLSHLYQRISKSLMSREVRKRHGAKNNHKMFHNDRVVWTRWGQSLIQGRHQEKNIQTLCAVASVGGHFHFTSRKNFQGEKTSSNLGLFTCQRGSKS